MYCTCVYIEKWPHSSGMGMGKWGLACLGISHGPCDGTAGDGLVPLVGLRYLLLTGPGGGGLPSPTHVGKGSCLVSEASSSLGKYLSLYREGGRGKGRERGREREGEGGSEGGRERGREGGREGGRERVREGGREEKREGGRERKEEEDI